MDLSWCFISLWMLAMGFWLNCGPGGAIAQAGVAGVGAGVMGVSGGRPGGVSPWRSARVFDVTQALRQQSAGGRGAFPVTRWDGGGAVRPTPPCRA